MRLIMKFLNSAFKTRKIRLRKRVRITTFFPYTLKLNLLIYNTSCNRYYNFLK